MDGRWGGRGKEVNGGSRLMTLLVVMCGRSVGAVMKIESRQVI